jgi:NDP-sugar pyrophosphorylase family protein
VVTLDSGVVAIVAAGGQGTRMDLAHPKSKLTVGKYSMLYLTVRALSAAGISTIRISCNSPEDKRHYLDSLSGFGTIDCHVHEPVSSTYEIFRRLADTGSNLFLYGHSPRPISVYRRFLCAGESSDVVAGVVLATSVRDPARFGRHLLEPPYLVAVGDESYKRFHSWKTFFEATQSMTTIPVDPPEFNTKAEWDLYARYVGLMMPEFFADGVSTEQLG